MLGKSTTMLIKLAFVLFVGIIILNSYEGSLTNNFKDLSPLYFRILNGSIALLGIIVALILVFVLLDYFSDSDRWDTW